MFETAEKVLNYWMTCLQDDSIKWTLAVSHRAVSPNGADWDETIAQWAKQIETDKKMIRQIVEDARMEIPNVF